MQDSLSLPEAEFLTGWSHGREALKNGSLDSFKGSFYVNCGFYHSSDQRKDSNETYYQHPELTACNVWPPEEMLPGFRQCFEDICTLIINTAVLVARQCDRYALAKIAGYEPGYLEGVVRLSTTSKARLLHYFPTTQADNQGYQAASREDQIAAVENDRDDWCATHVCRFGPSFLSQLLLCRCCPDMPALNMRISTDRSWMPDRPHFRSVHRRVCSST